MRILIYGSTYLTELCVNQLIKDGYNLIGYIPSKNPTFKGQINLPIVEETIDHDIKLSIQYDKKLITISDAYNLHTGLLPEYGGCSILYHTIKNKEQEQGLTLHKMGENFDEGGIVSKITYPVLGNDTVADLYMRMCSIAPKFLSNALQIIHIQGKALKPNLYKKDSVPPEIAEQDIKKIKERLNVRSCKIVAVSFLDGRDYRNQVEFPAHNQTENTSEDVRKMVEVLYDLEVKQDAGVPLDIYFINNDVGYERGNKWLDEINGTETKNGHIYVLHRKNLGGSFGVYDYAFQLLKERYDYFMFTEDDLFIFGDQYYRKAINTFEKYNLGFLAFIDVERVRNKTHAHGGIGLTSTKILERVNLKHGSLPHFTGDWDKPKVIRDGEIPFTNIIHEMGYTIDKFGEIDGWNSKNCLLPYFNYKNVH